MAAKAPLASALCALLVLQACAGTTTESGPAPDVVTVVVLPFLTQVPFDIAMKEGYFAQENLDVRTVRLPRVQDLMASLANGDVDAAAGWIGASLLNAMVQGVRIRAVMALGELDPQACPFGAFVVRRETFESGALDDPAQLREMLFDIDPLLPQGYWLERLLLPLGLTVDDVRTIDVPPQPSIEALRNGAVDMITFSEPLVTKTIEAGDLVIWRSVAEVAPGYSDSALLFGGSLLDQRPEVGERFATAMLRAVRRFQEGKTPANFARATEFVGLTEEELQTICWPVVSADAHIDAAGLLAYQSWSVRHGYQERELPAGEIIDNRFIDAANARLGH
ncbi:MAG: ABC transporter substrate-binding protein [Acidobacteriota bacterium]